MKTYGLTILFLTCLFGINACKEPTIDEGILPVIIPTSVDADGGTWQTIILSSAAAIPVPPPTAPTSDAYQQELTAIKNGILASTPEQNTAVNYWAVGGVVRWNQIARQLVAKYNKPPGYDYVTGQNTPADAANPYAGAPYAARVYALLSVAQYDALVVAWRAKYQYNRPSLEKQGVIARVPVLDVPSYPSEDAAVAEASCQLLAYLFPKEVEWLKAKATEHKQSRLWAGASVPSDVKAGEAIAVALVPKLINRAEHDRFITATDPANTWQTAVAKSPYSPTWKSLEIPERAPILPLAGNVRIWFDSTAIFRAFPKAPPAATSAEFKTALAEVRDIATTRTREQWRIASYWENGPNTYGLAGLWNFLAEDLIRQSGQNELRTARTYALLNRAMHDGTTAAWRSKYFSFVPRPSQLDPTIKTVTAIPNTPAYVSHQATVSAAAATVLGYLFTGEANRLNEMATEASLSGLYGGTQFRFSGEAGAAWGVAVGQLAVQTAKTDGSK